MDHEQQTQKGAGAEHGTLRTYILGFALSLIATFLSFGLVAVHLSRSPLAPQLLLSVLVALALVQFFVQLIFFLHLGSESRPRWNGIVFLYALLMVFILVAGSLWIMANLRHDIPLEEQYIGGVSPQTLSD